MLLQSTRNCGNSFDTLERYRKDTILLIQSNAVGTRSLKGAFLKTWQTGKQRDGTSKGLQNSHRIDGRLIFGRFDFIQSFHTSLIGEFQNRNKFRH